MGWLRDKRRKSSVDSEYTVRRRSSIGSKVLLLRKKRRRSLTPPMDPTSKPGDQNDQCECLFLSKLPYELREMVYWDVLTGHRYEKYFCIKQLQGPKPNNNPGGADNARPVYKYAWQMRNQYFLRLLLTCRRIYSEAVPLLYTTLPIAVEHTSFSPFAQLVPPHRFNSIRSLQLRCYFPFLLFPTSSAQSQNFDDKWWKATCATLADMSGLKDLHVSISTRDYTDVNANWPKTPTETTAQKLWAPLMDVRGCTEFVVYVSWDIADDERVEGAPFKLERLPPESNVTNVLNFRRATTTGSVGSTQSQN